MNPRQPAWGARGVLATIVRSWVLIVGVALVYGLMALLYSWLSTPIYQATATLYVTSGSGSAAGGSSFDAVRASQERAATYGKLLYSDAVISPALTSAQLPMSLGDAKNNLQVAVDPAVMTMSISATDPDPVIAQRLANAASDSLADAVSTLDVPSGGGSPAARLTIVNTAVVDPDPIWPKMYLSIGIAAGVGLIVGLCLALLFEKTNNKVRDEDDAAVGADAHVLAKLPDDASDAVVDFDLDRNSVAAAFRTLRTRLIATTQDAPIKLLAVTSPRSGAGTTTVAVNLAGALAHSGNSVLLLDADFADPRITRRFAGQGTPGIVDVLAGRTSLDSVLGLPTSGGFSVLGVGKRLQSTSADLLSSRAFGELLKAAVDRFDYVITAIPAFLDSQDAAASAAWADGVLIVVPLQSKIDELRVVRSTLDDLNTGVVGLVVSGPSGIEDMVGTDEGQKSSQHRTAENKPPGHEKAIRATSTRRA